MADIPQDHGGMLKPFERGQSGNPAGKPKGVRNRATIVKEFLDLKMKGNDLEGKECTLSAEELMWLSAIRKAINGGKESIKALTEVMDTVYGKNKDVTAHEGGLQLNCPINIIGKSPDEKLD